MKQVVTNKSGALEVLEVPAPGVRPGFVLVRTRYSLISAGTEGAQIREGKAGLLTKVREHPEQIQAVLGKLKREGVRSVAAQVRDKLTEWKPLGYSLSGEVLAVGEGITDLAPGDRVACAGAGYAVHAELVAVPRNLVARVPPGVPLRDACCVTLGAIALHGVRRAAPTLGEQGLVLGLGLIGQLAAQFLRASGVRVAVSDLDPARTALAVERGASLALHPDRDPGADVAAWTEGRGLDLALVCAATASSAPVETAARLVRDRARLVVVGDVGLELSRGPFYAKELDLTLSRSYGPGRYDPAYEEGGVDYPVGYVRWTEGRNLSAVLECLERGEVRVDGLVGEETAMEEAPAAYERILEGGGLGTVLVYTGDDAPARTVRLGDAPPARGDVLGVLVVGAGYFARTYHLPHLEAEPGFAVAGVVSGTGAGARHAAEKVGAGFCGTDLEEGLAQPGVDVVLIATRHHLHVPQTLAAVAAGKHVLVEKPPVLDADGLRAVAGALRDRPVRYAAGFNRRHAPLAAHLKGLLQGRTGPLHGVYRMNAGRLPAGHWVNDPVEGGGRILGEGCHAFDWFNFLTGAVPETVQASRVRSKDAAVVDDDNLTATVTYDDGSVLTLLYTTAGPRDHPKEQFEVFAPGFAAVLTDYRELRWRGARTGKKSLRVEDKGQRAEMRAWARYLRGEPGDVADFAAAALSMWLTLRALESARTGERLAVASTLHDVLGG